MLQGCLEAADAIRLLPPSPSSECPPSSAPHSGALRDTFCSWASRPTLRRRFLDPPPLHICVLASAPAIEGFGRHHLSQAPSTSNPQIAVRIVGDAGRHVCLVHSINVGTLRTLTGRCRSGLAPARSHGRRPSLPACIPGAWSGVIAAPELGLHTPRQSRASWALHIPGDVANLHAPPRPSSRTSFCPFPIRRRLSKSNAFLSRRAFSERPEVGGDALYESADGPRCFPCAGSGLICPLKHGQGECAGVLFTCALLRRTMLSISCF